MQATDMPDAPPPDSMPVICVMAMPADANAAGDIFGGWIVGDIICCHAEIPRTGRSSLTVNVKAYAERMHETHEILLVTQADLTYVAVDDQRRPRPLPVAG